MVSSGTQRAPQAVTAADGSAEPNEYEMQWNDECHQRLGIAPYGQAGTAPRQQSGAMSIATIGHRVSFFDQPTVPGFATQVLPPQAEPHESVQEASPLAADEAGRVEHTRSPKHRQDDKKVSSDLGDEDHALPNELTRDLSNESRAAIASLGPGAAGVENEATQQGEHESLITGLVATLRRRWKLASVIGAAVVLVALAVVFGLVAHHHAAPASLDDTQPAADSVASVPSVPPEPDSPPAPATDPSMNDPSLDTPAPPAPAGSADSGIDPSALPPPPAPLPPAPLPPAPNDLPPPAALPAPPPADPLSTAAPRDPALDGTQPAAPGSRVPANAQGRFGSPANPSGGVPRRGTVSPRDSGGLTRNLDSLTDPRAPRDPSQSDGSLGGQLPKLGGL